MTNEKKPAIQNIPVRTVTGAELRQVFQADRLFVEVDFGAIEQRIVATLDDETIVEEAEPATFQTAVCLRGEHADCDSFICGCPCHE